MGSLKLVVDSVIVDAIKNPCYVIYDARLGLFLGPVPESKSQGVASRDGTTYWHIEGKDEFGVDGYQTVDAISITDEEADVLIAELDAGKEPIEPTPDEGGETQPEEVITLATVYAQVQSTQAELDSLTAAIEKGLSL